MITTAKVLVPNKEWIIESDGAKFATLSKEKKGYSLHRHGQKITIKDLKEIKEIFDLTISDEEIKRETAARNTNEIYGFPINGTAYEPLWNVQKKLPIYSKSTKSKSLYCAGYYIIKFRKGWVKSFCPKLITLDRYPFQGPFSTEADMRHQLALVNKNENTQHTAN